MTTERSILIAADDATLLGVLKDQFQVHENYLTTTAETAKECLEQAKKNYFDIILLGVDFPDMDGCELCRLVRQSGVTSPILMLTEANTDVDRVLELDVWANDCVAKPFRLAVLLAKIRALISRHDRNDDVVIIIGPYRFQPSNKILVRDTDQCTFRLTDKETAILKYLYRAGDKVVSKKALLGDVWGYNESVTTHTLETHVYRLRQKIEPDLSNVTILITEPGGYRLGL